ncbi:hypothetical protein P1X14_00300 [Sphingomonas sp. AOB5]|uniref:hypothetical protein n=1 Tax=Sphingomonas sp. AOB5 TaxID=3034017 RepID=UPI0023FA31BE|nr:hypothetical protein [Sphingomonas sp. AOB5]MDF7773671.1 hypothetical protein [Sphingomonas sp. AOB5]
MAQSPKRKPAKKSVQSAYALVAQRQVGVELGGKPKKLGAKEALELRTYQDAVNGKYRAAKTVLGWIDEREVAKSPGQSKVLPVKIVIENSRPVPMDDALVLLGIVTGNGELNEDGGPYFKLQAWAVQEALDRHADLRTRRDLDKLVRQFDLQDRRGLEDLVRHTDNPDAVRWPKGSRDG